jgi:cohesin domain-containing protein
MNRSMWIRLLPTARLTILVGLMVTALALFTPATFAQAACNDGVKDGSETDVDCGGGVCPACPVGKACLANGDCQTGDCSGGVCQAALVCSPGFGNCDGNDSNGCETPLNTVTNCGGCGNICNQNNSSSASCNGMTCLYTCKAGFGDCNAAAPDTDGCETPLDTAANCGACANACAPGATCTGGACVSTSSCTDGVKDGSETDVDCGGGVCPACPIGKSCLVNGDCQSQTCSGGFCQQASTCSDGVKDGDETGVDCGGKVCPPCPTEVCVGSAVGDPGQRVTVPITLDDGTGVAGFQVDAGFDSALLSVSAARPGADTTAAAGWTIYSAPIASNQLRVLGESSPPAGLGLGPRQVALVDFDIADGSPFGPMSPFALDNCVLSDARGVQISCQVCSDPGSVTVRPAASFTFQPIDFPLGVDRFDPLSFPVSVEALTPSGTPATAYNGTAVMSVSATCKNLFPASLDFVSGVGNGQFSIACCLDSLLPSTQVLPMLQASDPSIDVSGTSETLKGYAKADVNADGAVNVLDLVPAIDFSLNLPVSAPPPVPFQRWAANMVDQTCAVDGFINVLDIVRIRNKALGRPPLCPCVAEGLAAATDQAAGSTPPVTPLSVILEKDGPKDFVVKVRGAVDLSGLQLELRAAGAKANVSLEGLAAGGAWQGSTSLSQGVLKVVMFTNSTTGVTGDGVVLRIREAGNPRITLVVASDSQGREIPSR